MAPFAAPGAAAASSWHLLGSYGCLFALNARTCTAYIVTIGFKQGFRAAEEARLEVRSEFCNESCLLALSMELFG